jgi:hypothetical protein
MLALDALGAAHPRGQVRAAAELLELRLPAHARGR